VSLCLDVYVRLPRLDRGQVERFLETHVVDWREAHAWLSEDADEILEAGLGGAASSETLYSRSRGVRDPELHFVMVAFPKDTGVVLGVSIDLDPDEEAAMVLAEQWLARLLAEPGAQEGFVQAEEPPPLTEAEWQAEMKRALVARSV
jgi:hypothetical protein